MRAPSPQSRTPVVAAKSIEALPALGRDGGATAAAGSAQQPGARKRSSPVMAGAVPARPIRSKKSERHFAAQGPAPQPLPAAGPKDRPRAAQRRPCSRARSREGHRCAASRRERTMRRCDGDGWRAQGSSNSRRGCGRCAHVHSQGGRGGAATTQSLGRAATNDGRPKSKETLSGTRLAAPPPPRPAPPARAAPRASAMVSAGHWRAGGPGRRPAAGGGAAALQCFENSRDKAERSETTNARAAAAGARLLITPKGRRRHRGLGEKP